MSNANQPSRIFIVAAWLAIPALIIGAIQATPVVNSWLNPSSSSGQPRSNSQPVSQSVLNDQPIAPKPRLMLANGSAHVMTLRPATVGEPGWNGASCHADVVFASTKNKDEWAKFDVQSGEHFATFYIGLKDNQNDVDNEVVSTSQVEDGKRFVLKTERFRAVVTAVKAVQGDGPDPEKSYPSIFKELTLSVQVQENPKGQ